MQVQPTSLTQHVSTPALSSFAQSAGMLSICVCGR